MAAYQFTKKEIKKEYKESLYGKFVNRKILICFVLTVLFVTLTIIYRASDNVNFLLSLALTSWVFFVYYDGKRDGMIAQLRINRKIKQSK